MESKERKLGIDVLGALPSGGHPFYFSDERQQVEEALRENEENYRRLFDLFPIGVTALDMKGVITYCNPAVYGKGGYSEGDLIGRHFAKIAPIRAKDIPKYIRVFKSILQGKVPEPFEMPYQLKDGTTGWTEIHVGLMKAGGNKQRILVIQYDITERKRAEEKLQFSDAAFRSIHESIVATDTEYTITHWNKRSEEIYGIKASEAIGKKLLNVIEIVGLTPGEKTDHFRTLEDRGHFRGERRHRTKHREVWVDLSIQKIMGDGKRHGWVALATDITERKRAEEALRESEVKYKSLVTNVKLGVFRTTPEPAGRFLEVNPAMVEITGYSRKELLQMNVPDLYMYPEERRPALEEIASGKGKKTREVRLRKQDGTEIVVSDTKVAVRDDAGKIIYFDGIMEDITERKQAEEAVLASEKKLLKAQRVAKMGFLTWNLKNNDITWSDEVFRIFGVDPKVKPTPDLAMSLIHPDDQESVKKNLDTAMQGIKKFDSYHRRVHPDGKVAWVHIQSELVRDADGNPESLLGIVVDITGRKQAEAELQKSRKMLSRVTPERPMTHLQERFFREGLRDLSESAGIRLIFNPCQYLPDCRNKIEKYVKHFKSARALLSAPDQELEDVGVCSRGLFIIKLLRELPAEVLKQKIIERSVYQSSGEIFNYLYYSMRDLNKEVFKIIYLNNRSQIIEISDLFEGTGGNIPVSPRKTVESAIKYSAAGLIFVHNHPTGDPSPSRSDKHFTRDLAFVGLILQIKVLDHIIIGDNSYFSFADEGLLQKYEDNFLDLKIRGVLASRPLYRHTNDSPEDFTINIR